MLNLDSIVSNKNENKDNNWPLAILKMYNYCTREPYSLITIDARPIATYHLRKTLMNH